MERVKDLVKIVIGQSGNSNSVTALRELMHIRIHKDMNDAQLTEFFEATAEVRHRFNARP